MQLVSNIGLLIRENQLILWTAIATSAAFGGLAVVTATLKSSTLGAAFLVLGAFATLIAGILASNSMAKLAQAVIDEEEREREMEARLDDQAATVDSLAEGLDVGIFICDSRATVLYANRRAEELFRFDDPIGRTLLAVTLSYDLEQLVLRARAEGVTVRSEIAITYPEERIAVAESWPDVRTERLFLSVYDITSLRKLERIRTDFVANVSHEIRTPLATIRTMAETMQDEPEDAPLRDRFLNKILTEVDRLSLITQDLLVLSAAESITARKQDCEFADIVRSVVAQLERKAASKGVELTLDAPERLDIPANYNQLTQVTMNLVDNAINYTNEGSVKVRLSYDDDFATLSVVDTGIGIPSDQIDRVFERFYRVDKGRSRATGGTGLGLSIVKHIVEAHGGDVRVESMLGRGSTFVARVPLRMGTISSEFDSESLQESAQKDHDAADR